MPFVTIGIPTYKQPEYIKEAIESVLAQTYKDLEIIVSDDSPDDETEKICKEYAGIAHFSYYHNRPALGRVANYRHLLYDLASSPFFLCLDGDDYLTDLTYIARAVNELLEDEQKVLIYANSATYFSESGHIVYDKNNASLPLTMDGDWFFINFPQGFGLSHQTILYNRQEAMKLGFYRYDIASADWESFLRLVQGHHLGHLPETVSVWRKHGGNETRHITLENILKNRLFIEEPCRFAAGRGYFSHQELALWREKMLTRFYVKSLLRLIFTGQKAAAQELAALIRREESAFLTLKTTRHPLVLMAKKVEPQNPLWRLILKEGLKMESFYYEFAALAAS